MPLATRQLCDDDSGLQTFNDNRCLHRFGPPLPMPAAIEDFDPTRRLDSQVVLLVVHLEHSSLVKSASHAGSAPPSPGGAEPPLTHDLVVTVALVDEQFSGFWLND
jgi:hypothetical protein